MVVVKWEGKGRWRRGGGGRGRRLERGRASWLVGCPHPVKRGEERGLIGCFSRREQDYRGV